MPPKKCLGGPVSQRGLEVHTYVQGRWISDYLALWREAPGSLDWVYWWGWGPRLGEVAWTPDSWIRKQKILGDQDKYPWAP